MGYKDIYTFKSIENIEEKLKFLEKHKEDEYFIKFLYFALSPHLFYNITEDMKDELEVDDVSANQKLIFFDDIFECCEYLSRLRKMDKATLRQVRLLLKIKYPNKEERELYKQLLLRAIDVGIGAEEINRVVVNLIPM